MNRLEQLIKELCPNGVEYKKLEDVAEYSTKKIDAKDVNKNSYVGVDNLLPEKQGKTYSTYVPEIGRLIKYEENDILIGNIRPYLKKIWLADICGGTNGDVLVIHITTNELLPKFLFYILSSDLFFMYNMQNAKGAKMPRGNKNAIMQYSIPIPPIEIQREIVRILDEYNTSVTALQQELEKELTARKKQYEYYRDMLLDFDSFGGVRTDFEWRTLGEVIISLNTGLNPRKFFRLNTDDSKNYYITIREIHNGKIIPTEKTDRLNDKALKLCNNRSNLEVGDVLFSGTGTIGETAVITENPTNWNIKEGVYSIKPIQSMVMPFFLHYLLQTKYIKTAYMKKVSGGTVKSIPMAEMKKLLIPIPPISEQQRIVAILDRFDKLCNDITEGLPAEIEARRKQYEYYRDKLLTFKELTI